MQSWLVTIRVSDDGMENDIHKGITDYLSEDEIKEELLKVNDLRDGLEITDITDIVKEK